MKFRIQNIGAIDCAKVDIDGITIIAGENNVGKSTIGKALFAFLHDMSDWEKIYDQACYSAIKEFFHQSSVSLEDFCMEHSGAKRRRTSRTSQLIIQYAHNADFRVALEDYQINTDDLNLRESANNLKKLLTEYCLEYLSLYFKDNQSTLEIKFENEIAKWVEVFLKQLKQLNLDEVELQKNKIKSSLQEIFNKQFRKIGATRCEIAFVDDMSRETCFTVDNEEEILNCPVRLNRNVYFIESPRIYDYISNANFGNDQKSYLQRMMRPNTFKFPMFPYVKFRNTLDETEYMSDELQPIMEHLVKVMGGQAEFLQKVGLEFKDNTISEPIHSVNVSTGLKSIALIEYAFRIGAIKKGDILILDEPEINLHPEWQLEYAKTIVDLQRNFEIKFIITSHSPFFMRAIECYTDIYGVMDNLNVYRVTYQKEQGIHQVVNVSYSEYGMSDLYEDLSAPLDKLDELLEKKYGEESE